MYNNKQLIGYGTQAYVYKVERNDKVCAIKQFRKRRVAIKEYKMLLNIKHENIIDMIGIDEDYALIFEYCNQSDLFNFLLTRQKFDVKSIMKDILNGLCYLHQNNIVHLDLKPENILIDNRTCKISDFGSSELVNHIDSKSRCYGSTPYISPELIENRFYLKGLDLFKCDVWSIGIIFFNLLYGGFPWPIATKNKVNPAILKNNLLLLRLLNFSPNKRPDVESIVL